MKIGVCLFDDPRLASGGWASDGGEARYIESYAELANDMCWITNIAFKDFKEHGFHQLPHLFDEQYLRTRVEQILKEVGLSSFDQRKEAAQFCAQIANRTVRMAEQMFKVDIANGGYRLSNALTDVLVRGWMRALPDGQNRAVVSEGLRQSLQENQAMVGVQHPKGSSSAAVLFPRGAFAHWLLSQDYPVSNTWNVIKVPESEATFGVVDGAQLRGTKALTERLLNMGRQYACIFRLEVLSTEEFYRPFATFAAGANRQRQWATLPEVLYLARFCKLHLHAGYYTAKGKLPFFEKISKEMPADEFAFSRGLLLENCWAALATPPRQGEATAVGAFLRAYDRIACGRLAEEFAANSFRVASYSSGRVLLNLKPSEYEQAADLAFKLGALMPAAYWHGGD